MRRHGAQARPAEEDILLYLERILGARPRAADFLEPGRDLAAALQLAECEARLDRAHRHYAAAQDVHRLEDFDYLQEHLEHVSKRHANHEKKLAGRYLREAQSRRDRALEHYLSHL